MKRRSLTPPSTSSADVHATRRSGGGARRASSDRVILRGGEVELTGWTLNTSRGGLRILVEDRVVLGQEFDVTLGTEGDDAQSRHGRVVWVQEETDGSICGIEFVNADGSTDPEGVPGPMP